MAKRGRSGDSAKRRTSMIGSDASQRENWTRLGMLTQPEVVSAAIRSPSRSAGMR
jgi:hypothetical protein